MAGRADRPHLLGPGLTALLLEILQVLVRSRVAVVSAITPLIDIGEVINLSISAALSNASDRTRFNIVVVCEFAVICGS